MESEGHARPHQPNTAQDTRPDGASATHPTDATVAATPDVTSPDVATPNVIESTVNAAQVLLAQRFGGAPELVNPEDLGGDGAALVLRCKVTPNPFVQQRTIVIKKLPPQADEGETMSSAALALTREVVAYQFTNTLPESDRPGPLLLAYDMAERMLILSDIGDGANFVQVLNHHSPEERKTSLRKLGRALGRMHSTTYGYAESYSTLLKRQCQKLGLKPEVITDSDIDIADLIHQGVNLMTANDFSVDPVVATLAEEAAQRQHRLDLHSFTPFDLAPDNILLTRRVVFLDFEWASFRDIAFDVACVIAGFPQDSTTPALNNEEMREFLASWRAEIVHVWPTARDERAVAHALMCALVGWSFMSLTMLYHSYIGSGQGRQTRAGLPIDLTRDAVSAAKGDQSSLAERRLSELPKEHLEDLATTLDAVGRFAQQYADSESRDEFDSVASYTSRLIKIISKSGVWPQRPRT